MARSVDPSGGSFGLALSAVDPSAVVWARARGWLAPRRSAVFREQKREEAVAASVRRAEDVGPMPTRRETEARNLPILGALASSAGLLPPYFVRAFKQSLGTPPCAYLRRLRWERAQVTPTAGKLKREVGATPAANAGDRQK